MAQKSHNYSQLHEGIEGLYECYRYAGQHQNGYHFVNVTKQSDGTFLWKNLCTQWRLIPTNKKFEFDVGKECVYYKNNYHKMTFRVEQNMVVCGYGPWNELFQKVRKFSDNYFNMKAIKNRNNNNNNINIKHDYSEKKNNIINSNEDETETEGCDNNGTNIVKKINNKETFMWKGGKCKKGQKIGRISILDNWSVEFTLVVHGKACDNWESILHVGNSTTERSPGIWLHPKLYKLHVRLSDTTNYNTGYDPNIELQKNTKYNIKFECFNETVKLFINNKMKSSLGDVTHITRFRAPIFCGSPAYSSANATIADLKIVSYV